MAMVHAATHAYEHKEGWADDAPPTDAYPQEQHLVAAEPVKPRDAPRNSTKHRQNRVTSMPITR